MKFRIPKLNEDVVINDPQLAQQYANGQSQLMDKDKQINSLQKQINNIEQQKNQISKKMAEIEKKAAQVQPQQQQPAQNNNNGGAPNNNNNTNVVNNNTPNNVQNSSFLQELNDSILIRENDNNHNELNNLYNTLNYLDDQLVTLNNNNPDDSEEYNRIQDEIYFTLHEIAMLENDDRYDNEPINTFESIKINPLSPSNFYLNEDYVEVDGHDKESKEDYEDKDYLFYLKIVEDGNEFIAKVFKMSPDAEWYGIVKNGESDTFEKISYDPSYNELDIVNFLSDSYDSVEIIDRHEFNDIIEDDIEYFTDEELDNNDEDDIEYFTDEELDNNDEEDIEYFNDINETEKCWSIKESRPIPVSISKSWTEKYYIINVKPGLMTYDTFKKLGDNLNAEAILHGKDYENRKYKDEIEKYHNNVSMSHYDYSDGSAQFSAPTIIDVNNWLQLYKDTIIEEDSDLLENQHIIETLENFVKENK